MHIAGTVLRSEGGDDEGALLLLLFTDIFGLPPYYYCTFTFSSAVTETEKFGTLEKENRGFPFNLELGQAKKVPSH